MPGNGICIWGQVVICFGQAVVAHGMGDSDVAEAAEHA